jgi:glucokinase
VVSGTGLANVYDYLCALYPHKVDPNITAKMDKAGDMKGIDNDDVYLNIFYLYIFEHTLCTYAYL